MEYTLCHPVTTRTPEDNKPTNTSLLYSRLCIAIVTAWLVVCTTIWETVYMSKCVNTLRIDWVELIRSVKKFLISSDIVLKIELKKLKSKVLNTLSKASANSSTLLFKSKTSVNIQKQCQKS